MGNRTHSSSWESEDAPWNYETYVIGPWEDLREPPLNKKKRRLIAAVVQNQVGVLSDLLDSPEWYNVRDQYGFSLLQIAIVNNNIEVFDYMLSLPNFPRGFVRKRRLTALAVALGCCNDIWMSEHFAYELIKKGACIDKVYLKGDTTLHRALYRDYSKVAKLLIEMGVDVNVVNNEGCSPLTLALAMSHDVTEVVTTLLAYGAEASIDNFESSLLCNSPYDVQEILFLYIFDQFSNMELPLRVLLKLAENKSALFYQVIECPIKITVDENETNLYFGMLCSISTDSLLLIIRKFGQYIKDMFLRYKFKSTTFFIGRDKVISLENLNRLLESELKASMIASISTSISCEIFEDFLQLVDNQADITQLYCYLLSYGLNIEELDLQIVYRKFGYCELFKILLHMDVQMGIKEHYIKDVMPVFYYDVDINLDTVFRNSEEYRKDTMKELLHYFAHPRLQELCCNNETIIDSLTLDLQKIPLLVELARNAFRKYFIKKFNIRTSKDFYSRLNWLEISNIHRKIITYETKLY